MKNGDYMINSQIETFVRMADAGSFSKAADELFVSSTAIIKQINLLEARLDMPLFVRSHRGLALTEAGESLYHDAKHLLQHAENSLARARKAMQGNEQIIRIGTSLMTPTAFLVELWPQIHAYYPNLKFQLVPYENTPENAGAADISLDATEVKEIDDALDNTPMSDVFGVNSK